MLIRLRTLLALSIVCSLLFVAGCEKSADVDTAEADDAVTQSEEKPESKPNEKPARGKITSFSADQVYINAAGDVENTQKLWMTPEKGRMEMSEGGEMQMTMIFRRDLGEMYMIMPAMKRYTVSELDEEDWEKTFEGAVDQEIEDLGRETVNGYKCRKKRVKTSVEIMGVDRTSTATVWQSDQIGLPIRTEMDDGSITELRNIKKGRQPGRLFEPPSDYTKVEGGMMNMFQ